METIWILFGIFAFGAIGLAMIGGRGEGVVPLLIAVAVIGFTLSVIEGPTRGAKYSRGDCQGAGITAYC